MQGLLYTRDPTNGNVLYHMFSQPSDSGQAYRSAVQHFTLCVSAPTHVLNTIMLEAYKKCAARCSVAHRATGRDSAARIDSC